MTLSNYNRPCNTGVNAAQTASNLRTDLRGNLLRPDEYDPIQLRFEMDWSLERLAEEIDYSISSCLYWSSGRSQPSRQAKKKAFEVHQKLLEVGRFDSDNPTQEQLLSGWKLLQQMGLADRVDQLLSVL